VQTYTIPHDGTWATHTHNTLLDGTATDPNGDPIETLWTCVAQTPAKVRSGCKHTSPILNAYSGANGQPFITFNDGCVTQTNARFDGGARAFGAMPEEQDYQSTITSTDAQSRVLLPPGVHTCTLRGRDVYGAEATDVVVITIQAEPNTQPAANAGSDQEITVPHDADHTAGVADCVNTNGKTSDNSQWGGAGGDTVNEVDSKRLPTGTSCQQQAKTGFVKVALDASSSTDPESDKMRYRWSCAGSGVSTTGAKPTVWLSKDMKDAKNFIGYAAYSCCGLPAQNTYSSQGNGWCRKSGNTILPYIKYPAGVKTQAQCTALCDGTGGTRCKGLSWSSANGCVLYITSSALLVDDYPSFHTGWTAHSQANAWGDIVNADNTPGFTCLKKVAGRGTGTSASGSTPDVGCANDGGSPSKCVLPCSSEAACKELGKKVCDKYTGCSHIHVDATSTSVTLRSGSPACGSGSNEKVCTRPASKTTQQRMEHKCTLTVEDSYGATHTSDTWIKIKQEPNTAPVANAGQDGTWTVPHDGDPITNSVLAVLDGSTSTDVDGDRLDYRWSCKLTEGGVEYASATGRVTTIPLVKGKNWCTLYVADTYGVEHKDVVIHTVNQEPNTAPTVSTVNPGTHTIPHDGDPSTNTVLVTLDGYASSNTEDYKSPDGKVILVQKDDILTYKWECKIGSLVTATSTDATTVVPLKQGSHVCTLTVTDSYGSSWGGTSGVATGTRTIPVNAEPNNNPTATVQTIPAHTIPHDGDPSTNTVLVTLDGYASSNTENYMSPDGKLKLVSKDDILTYKWECKIGTEVTATATDATTVVPLKQGTHACTLTVTDTYGQSNSQTNSVVVHAEPNTAPDTKPGVNQGYTVPHDGDLNTKTVMVTLDGSATADTESYKTPDGKLLMVAKDDVLTYLWECKKGTPVTATSTDATTVVPLEAGTHICTLTVTDTYNAATTKQITITVTVEPNTTPVAAAGPNKAYTVPHDGRTFTNTAIVTLDGSASTDNEQYKSPDGKVVWETKSDRLDYQWSCPTAGVKSSDVVTQVAVIAGTHTCTLTVTDTYGASYATNSGQHSDTVVITVGAEPNMGFRL